MTPERRKEIEDAIYPDVLMPSNLMIQECLEEIDRLKEQVRVLEEENQTLDTIIELAADREGL